MSWLKLARWETKKGRIKLSRVGSVGQEPPQEDFLLSKNSSIPRETKSNSGLKREGAIAQDGGEKLGRKKVNVLIPALNIRKEKDTKMGTEKRPVSIIELDNEKSLELIKKKPRE